jgi:phosphoribosylformylglycinamidine synthase
LVGESKQELGASELAFMLREKGDAEGIGGEVPQLPEPEKNLAAYKALTKAIQSGTVRTAHDCSEGGVGVSIAEMCIGGRCGAAIDVDGPGEADLWGRLWGESLGRIIVGVKQQNRAEFLSMMKGNSLTYLGETTDGNNLSVWDGDDLIIDANVDEMVSAWKGSLDMMGGDQ